MRSSFFLFPILTWGLVRERNPPFVGYIGSIEGPPAHSVSGVPGAGQEVVTRVPVARSLSLDGKRGGQTKTHTPPRKTLSPVRPWGGRTGVPRGDMSHNSTSGPEEGPLALRGTPRRSTRMVSTTSSPRARLPPPGASCHPKRSLPCQDYLPPVPGFRSPSKRMVGSGTTPVGTG